MRVILICIFFFTSLSFAQIQKKKKNRVLLSSAKRSYLEKKPFIASAFLKAHLLKSDSQVTLSSKLLVRIIERTNIYPFLDIPLNRLKALKQHSNINYLIGKKLFFLKQNKEAINHFLKVNSKSPFYLQSLMHLASLSEIEGNIKKSIYYAKRCIKEGTKGGAIIPLEDKSLQQKYREHITDSCQVLIPRTLYKAKKIQSSLKVYERLSKQSFQFPASLFETSWGYLLTKDYNRAVGKNLTFQAPIFEDYFIPETELVKTLSYLKLCNYDEAISVIKNFEKNIRSKAVDFMKEFKLRKKGSYPFLNLIFGKSLKAKFKDNFIVQMSKVLDLKPSMLLLKHYLTVIKKEKTKVSSSQEKKAFSISYSHFAKFFNSYVKLKFVSYMKEVVRISNIFSEIEVDLYSVIKHRLYDEKEGKKVLEKRTYFYIKNIDRKVNQYYWNFRGEFWADELGHYIPLLENKCKKKLVRKDDDS